MPKITGKENTTPQLCALIYSKHQEGMTTGDIATFVNAHPQTIQRIIKNYNERGHHDDAPRTGRPHKLDERALRHIKISLEGNRRQCLSNLTSDINNALTSPVHPDTVHRTIHTQLGMNACVAAKKPFLKPIHKKERLFWARTYRNWEQEDWKHIIWTDEASVELEKGSSVVWVWRRPGERYLDKCLTPTFKSGRQSLMIWGCIAYGRIGPLIRIPKDQKTGADYVDLVLGGPLLDIYMELSEERGLVAVMEDGAPVHRCNLAKNFRTRHKIDIFPHPAQSPDLNPIEHVWKKLKVQINQRDIRPKTVDEMWEALQEEWQKIDVEFINKLISSMPNRAEAVYMAKGGSTKY
jgi:transposase